MKLSNRAKIEGVQTFGVDKILDSRGSTLIINNIENQFSIPNSTESLKYGSETFSKKYVLRGIHYQLNKPQCRLLRISYGAIYDVVLDLRKSSPTFGKWQAEFLSSENTAGIFVPAGVAHAYLTLSEFSIINIFSDVEYDAESQRVIRWDDNYLGIDWPLYDNFPIMLHPSLSERDISGLNFLDAEYFDNL